MTRPQIILAGAGLLLVILLYSLPKVVVDNDESSITTTEEEVHSPENGSSTEIQAILNSLKDSLSIAGDTKKSAIFADSLADSYRSLNHFDSAAMLYEQLLTIENDSEAKLKAADAYFEAYTYAVDDEKRGNLAAKARKYYEEVIAENPDNLDARTNLGMIIVGTDNPMQGIGMLREVLEKDPTNYAALYNMGVLSLQSNQVSKAVERFEKLVENYPESTEGRFYLGLSYLKSGEKQKAKEQFEIVKQTEQDPSVQATVDSYLEEIE